MPRTGKQFAQTAKTPDSEAPTESGAVRPPLCVVGQPAGEPIHGSTRPACPQPRAAIYSQVSTNGQDPEMQLREVREFCARRGWQVIGEYVDRGISGLERAPARAGPTPR